MKGLLFIPEMARAAMRDVGPKTNTRRVIVNQPDMKRFKYNRAEQVGPWSHILADEPQTVMHTVKSDYVAGECRCLLTTWAVDAVFDHLRPTQLSADRIAASFWHAGMTPKKPLCNVPPLGKSRPGRFLPNTLRQLMPVVEIVSVGAERVQDISTADIIAEGVTYPVRKVSDTKAAPLLRLSGDFRPGDYLPTGKDGLTDPTQINHEMLLRAHWASLWDSINFKRGFGWATNPWVWRVEFRRFIT